MSDRPTRRQFFHKGTLWLNEEDDRHIQATADRLGISFQDAARLLIHLGYINLEKLAKAIQSIEGGTEDEKQSEMRPHE